MKKEHDILCPGCMEKKEYDGLCRRCNYSGEETGKGHLEVKTILNSRFLLGKLMSYNGESALYMGYDLKDNKKITVKEYLPKSLCSRTHGEDYVSVSPQQQPLYKTYLSEFIDLNRNMMEDSTYACIQKVLEVFIANNTAYVVFEYIEGLSFKTYLLKRGGSLPLEEAKTLLSPVLASLNSIHQKGVIHRGIGLSTLLVNEKNELRIIGFDIAAGRSFGSLIDCQIFPGYSAPELYNASARQGSWTDVYSLCAVLYKTLTGLEPLSAPDRLKADTLKEPAFFEQTVPQSVSKTIMRGLSLDVNQRVRSINELTNLIYRTPMVDDVTRDINLKSIHTLSEESLLRKPQTVSKQEKQQKINAGLIYAVGILTCFTIIGLILMMAYPNRTATRSQGEATAIITATPAYTTLTSSSSTYTTAPPQTTAQPTGPLYKIPDFSSRMYSGVAGNPVYKFKIIPEYEYNETVAAGIIFGQDIEEGEEVTANTEITVKVSKGNGLVPLPDYTGANISDYKAILKSLEIQFKSAKEFSEDIPEDIVIRCNAQVGEKVDVPGGEVVEIFYSKGPRNNE